jgi:FkbM family methyltransferase
VKLPRDLPRALGLDPEPPPREYPYEIKSFTLQKEGEVRLARWLHPGEMPKVVTQRSVDMLRTFLREGDVAVDIGAHSGDSTLPIGLAVGTRGAVFALEPNPFVFKVLAANATLNADKARIVPLMFAAMAEDGEYEFRYTDSGYCNGGFRRGISHWKYGHFAKLTVQGRNLFDYLRREAPEELSRIRYIKIDTEGFDPTIVRSIAGLLQAVRPYFKTEIYKHLGRDERTAYFEELRALGYRLFKCDGERYRGEEVQPADVLRWKHFDMFAVPVERL